MYFRRTKISALYSINRLVFITETGCVYCAVRTGPLNKIDHVASLKCLCCITLLNLHRSSDYIEHKPVRCHVLYILSALQCSRIICWCNFTSLLNHGNRFLFSYRFYNSTERQYRYTEATRIYTLQLNSHKVQQIHIYWWSGRWLSSPQSP
jgi:hypothetical protein